MPNGEDVQRIQDAMAQEQALAQTTEAIAQWRDVCIVETKQFRVDLDAVLQRIKKAPASRERSLTITKLQEAIMWLGMDLKERNAPNPYPNSYNPTNALVEPTADNLKL